MTPEKVADRMDVPIKFVCFRRRKIRICAYNDNKHINLNDKEEQQLWITKNW